MRIGKKISDLPFGWREKMLDMADNGYGVAEIIKELGMTYSIHKTLLKNEEEYRAAWEDTTLYSEAWWMKIGRENLGNNKFNNVMWIFNMKNRFKWRDQPLIDKPGTGSSFDDEREKDILLSKYQSKVEKSTLTEPDKIQ